MNRRDAIKRTAMIMGYAVSASAIVGVMNGCKADPQAIGIDLEDWTPSFFTKDEGKLIAGIAECIIPKTDTPGAIEAGVHSFIDNYMKNNATGEEQKRMKKGLVSLEKVCQGTNGKSFNKSTMKEQTKVLKGMEKEAKKAIEDNPQTPTLWFGIKELTMLGYFTSEVGAKQFLKYDPIPGDYQACIPYEEVGGTWAL